MQKQPIFGIIFSVFFYLHKLCKVYYICLIWSRDFENARTGKAILIIDLVTVFHAILTSRQT